MGILGWDYPSVARLSFYCGKRAGRPAKHAHWVTRAQVTLFELTAFDAGFSLGMRYYCSDVFLMIAALRFSDTKVAYDLWIAGTSLFGRSRDLKRKGRPMISWETPFRVSNLRGRGARFPACAMRGEGPLT